MSTQRIYTFIIILTIDSDFSLNRINQLVILMEKNSILCKVGTQFIDTSGVNWSFTETERVFYFKNTS